MLTAVRKLQRVCDPHRLAVSVFVSIAFFLYIATVLGNDTDRRRQRQDLGETTQQSQTPLDNQDWSQQTVQQNPNHEQGQQVASFPGGVLEVAHRLTDPDAFRLHFEAVERLPAVSFQDAKAACSWEDESKINFQFTKSELSWLLNTSWTLHEWPQEELDAARGEWQQFVKQDLMPWKDHAHRFSGRGIVYVAGSGRSMKRVSITLRKLKKLGSTLPIELHYWGDEMSEEKKKMLTDLWPSITFNNLSSSHNIFATSYDTEPGHVVHYNLKTAALINTHFAEPLLLDDDNIPAAAPDSLWDSATYKEYGTIFWPDLARTRPNNPIWSITNTPCRMNEYEQESGQLLVDKRRFFYHLQLSAWMNAPSVDANGKYLKDSYYSNFLLGDKDTFRFAWHALKTKYGAPSRSITSVGMTLQSGKYCGHTSLQHHPDGSPLFFHTGLLKAMPKETMKWQKGNGGVFRRYKRSGTDHRHEENVVIGLSGGFQDGLCIDFPEVEDRDLEEIVPGFERDFDEFGGYWMLDD